MKTLNKTMLTKFSDPKNRLFVRIIPKHPAHAEMLKMLPMFENNLCYATYYDCHGFNFDSIPVVRTAIPIEAMFNEDPTTEDVMGWNEEYRMFYSKWRYPQGCVYESAGAGKKHTCNHDVPEFGKLHGGCSNISAGFLKGFLFCDGRWSGVVSLPADDTKPAEPTAQPEQVKPEVDQPELIPVTKENYRIGMKVIRGKDWAFEDQDGGEGNVGELIWNVECPDWKSVKWQNGDSHSYRVGDGGKYDLYIAPGEPEYGQAGAAEPRETPPDTDREIVGWRLNIDVPELDLCVGTASQRKIVSQNNTYVCFGFLTAVNSRELIPVSILRHIAEPIYSEPITFTTEAGATVTLTEGDIERIVKLKK